MFLAGSVCAHGGDDHAGQGDVHDESREGGIHLLVEKSRARGNDAANDGDAQGEHLQKDGHEGHGLALMVVMVCKVKRGVILPREGFGAAWGHLSNYSVQMAQLTGALMTREDYT